MSGDDNSALEWKVRLSARDPQKTTVIFALAGVALVVGLIWINLPVAIMGVLLVLGSTAEFWMPVSCKLDATGGTSRCGLSVTAIEWANVKRVIVADDGVKLSPLAAQTRSAPFRGVFLRFADNRDAVLRYIRERLPDVDHVERGPDGRGDTAVAGEGRRGDQEAQNGDSGSAAAGDA